MRLIAAANGEIQRAGRRDVVDVTADAGEQTRILGALDALPDEFGAEFYGGRIMNLHVTPAPR
jgi:hypothetical protein